MGLKVGCKDGGVGVGGGTEARKCDSTRNFGVRNGEGSRRRLGQRRDSNMTERLSLGERGD